MSLTTEMIWAHSTTTGLKALIIRTRWPRRVLPSRQHPGQQLEEELRLGIATHGPEQMGSDPSTAVTSIGDSV